MSRSSIRLGFSTRDERRLPGIGRHFGLFHMAGLRDRDREGINVSVGRLAFDRGDLEPLRERGIRLKVRVVGLLRLDDDVSPALARSVLDARVLGRISASAATKAALTAK